MTELTGEPRVPGRVIRTAARWLATTLLAGLVLVQSSCGQPARGPTSAGGVASTTGQLGADLYQNRTDVQDRRIQVRIHNAGTEDVVVQRMVLTSTLFDGPMVYPKTGSTIGGGRGVDLPVSLGKPLCDDPRPRHTVHLDYQRPDGSRSSIEVHATDDDGAVAALTPRSASPSRSAVW